MELDVLLLSRIKFAFTVAFHYIYPPLSIGIGLLLVAIGAFYLKTKDPIYHQMARFWTKVFALTFAIGVATGIVMEFEFGTNWSTYSRYVGDVFGSPLAAEGIFAFFLESGFLGILLFGWNRVGPKLHFFSTCMVALGAHMSALWIIVANSWMQTPAGFQIVGEGMDARAEIVDFWAMVFNPSSMDRLGHTLIGCWQAGAWLMVSVAAYYLLKKRHTNFAKMSMRFGLTLALISSLLSLVSGHKSAEGVAVNQPAKLAAFEGLWDTQSEAPMYLFGYVNEETKQTHGLAIPGMLSFLVHGDPQAEVTGLNAFDDEDLPPVNLTFQFYHIMIIIGMGLIAVALWATFEWWRKGSVFSNKFLLFVLTLAFLGPQIANQIGWFAAEVGRQPWIVYNLLRTSEGLSKVVSAEHVLAAIVMFLAIYLLLFFVFIYLLNKKIQHGPDPDDLTIPPNHLPRKGKA